MNAHIDITPELLARRAARGARFMTYCIAEAQVASVMREDARRDNDVARFADLTTALYTLHDDQIEYALDAGIIQ